MGYNISFFEYKRFVKGVALIQSIRQTLQLHEPTPAAPRNRNRSKAAVLVPLIDDDSVRLLLTLRAGKLSAHGGEVALPGGREDIDDLSSQYTALRETEEEIGVSAYQVEVIGELQSFVSKYGLLVTPIVGVIPAGLTYRANPAEIDSIFEVPLDFFTTTQPIRIDELNRQGEFNRVPAYNFDGYEIWGLTALIIGELLRVISAAEP
ncbi:MAG TPA: CoA pyrophosphatase [Gammaproteobacteria bacterium]|nr:CoA pyrophosphatase [Gammaproteobacteria bacterium]